MRLRLAAVAALACWIAIPSAAERTEPERRSDAADVADFIAAQTQAVIIPSNRPGQSADPQAQVYVDRLGALAAQLETDLRAGADLTETRETYRQMRRVRLELIAYAMRERVELPLVEGRLFEQMLAELSRYHRGE